MNYDLIFINKNVIKYNNYLNFSRVMLGKRATVLPRLDLRRMI